MHLPLFSIVYKDTKFAGSTSFADTFLKAKPETKSP